MTRVYEQRVREALSELSDEAFQRRAWTGTSGEVASFDECVNGMFDDSGLGDALDRGDDVFGATIDADLRKLDQLIAAVDKTRRLSRSSTIRR